MPVTMTTGMSRVDGVGGDLAPDLESIDPGQEEIEHDEIGGTAVELSNRLEPAAGFSRLESSQPQR